MKRSDTNGGRGEISITEGGGYDIAISAEEIQNFPSGSLTYILFTPGENRKELFSGTITVSGFESKIAILETKEYCISQEFSRDDEFRSIIPTGSVITMAIVKPLSGSGLTLSIKYGTNGPDATHPAEIREGVTTQLDILKENCFTTEDLLYVTSENWNDTTLRIWIFYKKVI